MIFFLSFLLFGIACILFNLLGVQQLTDLQRGEFTSLRFWTTAKGNPMIFNPSKIDCNQWTQIVKQVNMKFAVFRVENTSGFTLGLTKYFA